MAVSKMNKLARALAIMGLLAPAALATDPLSAYATTDPAVSQEQGSTTSDGLLLYTWSICSVIHNTACEVSTSTAGEAPPATSTSSEAGVYPVPSGGEGSAPPGGSDQSSAPGDTQPNAPQPTETGVNNGGGGGGGGGGGSETVTQISLPETGAPGEPVPTAITTTDASGNPTTITGGKVTVPGTSGGPIPSGTESGSASGSASGSPTVTGGEGTNPSETSGAPSATDTGATGAAAMLRALPAGIFGGAAVVMVAAYL